MSLNAKYERKKKGETFGIVGNGSQMGEALAEAATNPSSFQEGSKPEAGVSALSSPCNTKREAVLQN